MGELIWLLALVGACSESLGWAHGRRPTLRTWLAAPAEYREWLADRLAGYGYGDGNGYGECYGAYGYGYGEGYGEGYGAYGYGNGYGNGYGEGYGAGDGAGNAGYGYGAYGYGEGYGAGDGYGYGYGYGAGYGYGDGNGYGEGYGYGEGNGYGDRMAEDIVSVVLADGTELCGDVGDAAGAAIGRLVVEGEEGGDNG